MTLEQSRQFVLACIGSRQPVYFSEEAIRYIDSQGYIEGDQITWRGKTYKVVKVHEATRIVETVKVKRLRSNQGPEPIDLPIAVECAGPMVTAMAVLPTGISHEFVAEEMAMMRHSRLKKQQGMAQLQAPQGAGW